MHILNKKKLLCTLLLLYSINMLAQENLNILANLPYEEGLSDVWGYADGMGEEYALVGTVEGFSIVQISDPTNPVELFFIDGPNSIWRDIKTWQHYAYVSNEESDGLLIVDMSNLPQNIDTLRFTADGYINEVHNLWVDEHGFLYVVGFKNVANDIPTDERGVAIFDLNNTPMSPEYVHTYSDEYVHDVYVRDNIMYTSEIYLGHFAVVDINDKTNPIVLTTQQTPSTFTHNAWLSDNSEVLFTSDERNGAYVTAYDISDLGDIKELDRYQSSPGNNVMVHNVHVLNDYLIVSYYNDGVRVIDANEPDALVEIAYFDTSLENGSGSAGCWGAYPFLPSGNILASDRQQGLFIFAPHYERAAYVQGLLTDATTGAAISKANVFIQEHPTNRDESDFIGEYKFGTAAAGTYTLVAEQYGYESAIIDGVALVNDEIVEVDIALHPLPAFNLQVEVLNATTLAPIENALVQIDHSQGAYAPVSATDGTVVVSTLYEDVYNLFITAWGYHPQHFDEVVFDVENYTLSVLLTPGYYDDFVTDLGWSVNSTEGIIGSWVREKPQGTVLASSFANPNTDVLESDYGDICYVTGNGPTALEAADLENGTSSLSSPIMDLTGYENPHLSFYRWFYSSGTADDVDYMAIKIFNGIETVIVKIIDAEDAFQSRWKFEHIVLNEVLTVTNTMQFIVEARAYTADVLVEAGIDLFQVTDAYAPFPTNIETNNGQSIRIKSYPNPFTNEVNISIPPLKASTQDIVCSIYNQQGQLVYKTLIAPQQQYITWQTSLQGSTLYLLQLGNAEIGYHTHKLLQVE